MFEFKDKARESLVEGHADFEVLTWDDHYNAKGQRCLKLTFNVSDRLHNTQKINDFFSIDTTKKITALLESTGHLYLMDESGRVDPKRLLGLKGECVIKKKAGTEFMNIWEYIPYHADPNEQQQRQSIDDDLPF